jgi:hypothetical protein
LFSLRRKILFVCLFVYSHASNFSAIWWLSPLPVTGPQILGLCSALRVFKQGGIFIVPHLLQHGTSVYTVSSERPSDERSVCQSFVYTPEERWRNDTSQPEKPEPIRDLQSLQVEGFQVVRNLIQRGIGYAKWISRMHTSAYQSTQITESF